MVLNSEEEFYKFYIVYAWQEGFGITKQSTRSGDDGKLKYFTLEYI